MRATRKWLMFFLVAMIALFPMISQAVSYSTIQEEREEKAAKGIREKGETVCLFQSGTEDVKKAIKTGDVLAVFRQGEHHELQEVGKIKVLVYTGDNYLKGVVLEGEARNGDIAKKGGAGTLIISPEETCNQ